ncbi:cupredoxin domain-containing protein [Desulfurispirillum indicum]|uniref:Cytochrome c oxidase subunit II n=1 Tax=Desulfurispirillum indicum (strain ATCC BAA-1389 / DSM 22839 / S5) TaxID=653733 RepID=E6W0Y3_DESIS|nr:cupredoxin domain-containing protein [Desulfurispirillum indicum]ADU65315.1 cytochrome c oxidase subunit II [Desulfurispirillum indicum S5]UCZ57211.1 cupredoxin domain-containing protein [Desulfurispirillum indicum]
MKYFTTCLLAALFLLGFWVATPTMAQAERLVEIDVHASQFEYKPSILRVQQGDRVRITLISEDVTHGLYIDGYDISVQDMPQDRQVNTLEFVADKAGNFTFRCNVVCGPMHPFMVGTLIVEPNAKTPFFLILGVLVALGSLFYVYRKRDRILGGQDESATYIDLSSRYRWVATLLKQRWLQYVLMAVNVFFFTIILYAGFAGTKVGNANFSLIFVWIVWWAALILLLLPLGGRLWCTMCPLPAPGEWMDHRAFVDKGKERPLTLANKWPKRFKNIWLQNWSFLLVAMFSGIILTRPFVTAVVLSLFIGLAIVFSLMYGKRIFCRYLCPVSGFIGLYSLVAPLGVRVADKDVCRNHKQKECIVGTEKGYGCPWLEVPWNMDRNAYCGICTECFKTCSQNNVRLVWQKFGQDLLVSKGKSIDEAYKAFIMLSCALAYSVIFQSSWGAVKSWANLSMPGFAYFASGFLALNLVIVPVLFALSVWIGHGMAQKRLSSFTNIFYPVRQLAIITKGLIVGPKEESKKAEVKDEAGGIAFSDLFITLSYVLVPLGLACWMAFSVSFLFINGIYILHVISDPFGWGWNLFGTRDLEWKPVGTSFYPYIQALILLVGLYFSNNTGARLLAKYPLEAGQKIRLLLPVTAFLTIVTGLFLWLFL